MRPVTDYGSRQETIFADNRQRLFCDTDRMFAKLLLVQWVFAIGLALVISPWSYDGGDRFLHFHVKVAILFGGVINALPLSLVWFRPGWWLTRHSIAVTQMMWSAVLIMITGGRIETHFHVFGSLAFLSFYRDWKLLPTATAIVAADHLVRGLWWPDSVYGIANPEWWRFLEHAGWVAFEDLVLVYACVRGVREMRADAARQARLENMKSTVEGEVEERTLALQESMRRYRALVENTAAVPFELAAADFRLLYLAPQATGMFDCDVSDLQNQDLLRSLVHPDDRQHIRASIEEFARTERPAPDPIDFRIVTKTGREVFARTLLATCDRGRIGGIMFDVTKQKQLEAELQQAQKLESVGRLAAGVAHEINTPVQFVSDSIKFVRDSMTDVFDVVRKQQQVVDQSVTPAAREANEAVEDADLPYLTEEMPKALERAIDGLDRVAVIVRSMKVFAHPSGGLVNVDINAAVQSTLTIARNEYRYCAELETTFDGTLPPVSCFAGEINQVILNVVLNSAHAIGDVVKGTNTRGKITVRTRRDGDHVVISIGDTGGGIPEHVRPRIFDPFFTTKPVGKGTGQGLAIARSVIVDKHHGAVSFETKLGVGTTFHVRIPIAHPSSQQAGQAA